MTVEHGLGMLACGMILILVAGLIIYKVINIMDNNKKLEKQKKEMEKLYGK